MQLLRTGRAALAVVLTAMFTGLGPAAGARAEILEFGWSGTVLSVDPAFASELPVNSGIGPGSSAFVRFEFESTTPDQDPSLSTGDYVGSITSFTLQIGSFAFTQQTGAALNSIIVFSDAVFGFYEPQTSVAPSTPIAGFADLRSDVFFTPFTPSQILDDSLFLAIPDPPDWSTAVSGVLDPTGSVLVEVRLDAICVDACQPPDPTAVPTLHGIGLVTIVGAMLVVGCLALARATRDT